jgi:hypothetical protein
LPHNLRFAPFFHCSSHAFSYDAHGKHLWPMASKRNEQQTRFELINPALAQRGWLLSDIRVEEMAKQLDIIDGKPVRRLVGRTDYLLRRPLAEGAEPIPLAIIEAKHEGRSPTHGLQQGKEYRVGELNNVPFVFSSNGHLFIDYDEATGQTSEAKPLSEFPRPEELVSRYLAQRQLPVTADALKLLTTGYTKPRGAIFSVIIRTPLCALPWKKSSPTAPPAKRRASCCRSPPVRAKPALPPRSSNACSMPGPLAALCSFATAPNSGTMARAIS